jgi:hypothetical protein
MLLDLTNAKQALGLASAGPRRDSAKADAMTRRRRSRRLRQQPRRAL